VSLTQIQYFVAVAEEENVTRAARRLHVSQPPLSRQLLKLEDELGAPLFDRGVAGDKRMQLSPEGRMFLGHARRILAEVEAATRAVKPCETRPA